MGRENTLYYRISPSGTMDSYWVFDDYSHLFPKLCDNILGKVIYLKKAKYINDVSQFKVKTINGLEYHNLAYVKDSYGNFVLNNDYNIKVIVNTEMKDLQQECPYTANILASTFSCFKSSDIVEISEPRSALYQKQQNDSNIYSLVDYLAQDFQIPIDQFGLTGTLALGAKEANDIDLVIYGDENQLRQVVQVIDYYIKKYGVVHEYGLNWPCRFYDKNGRIVCCFFNYDSSDYIDFLCQDEVAISNESISFSVSISDDTYSIAKIPYLLLNNDTYHSLIIYDRAFKGVFRKGDLLSGVGRIVNYKIDGLNRKSILCLNPFSTLLNSTEFYNRDWPNWGVYPPT